MLVNKSNYRENISFAQDGLKASRVIKRVAVKDLKYGPNGDYYKGDLLFTYNHDWLAQTILYFTRREREPKLRATHVAIIFDENTCIETTDLFEKWSGIKAVNGKKKRGKITYTDLKTKYLDKEEYRLYIRSPRGMDEEMRDEFLQNAQKFIGTKYARALLIVMALRNSFVGHLIDKASNYKYFDKLAGFCEKVSSKMYKKGTIMCSHFTSKAMNMTKNWPMHHKGVLVERPANSISPQRKIGADELFEPRIVQIR